LQRIAAKYPRYQDSNIRLPIKEGSMLKCVSGCGTGLLAAMVAAAMLGNGQAARAADDCLTAPDRPTGPGGHWYYHLDRGKDRKCWYLVEPEARAPAADPPPQSLTPTPAAPPAPAPQPQPSPFETFFSRLAPSPAAQDGAPQPAPAPTYNTQSVRPDNTDTAALPHPIHTTRRTDVDDPPAAKPHRPAHPAPVQTGSSPAAPSEQNERDALFQEFLRWRGSSVTGPR
jgi:hypothetical protein